MLSHFLFLFDDYLKICEYLYIYAYDSDWQLFYPLGPHQVPALDQFQGAVFDKLQVELQFHPHLLH